MKMLGLMFVTAYSGLPKTCPVQAFQHDAQVSAQRSTFTRAATRAVYTPAYISPPAYTAPYTQTSYMPAVPMSSSPYTAQIPTYATATTPYMYGTAAPVAHASAAPVFATIAPAPTKAPISADPYWIKQSTMDITAWNAFKQASGSQDPDVSNWTKSDVEAFVATLKGAFIEPRYPRAPKPEEVQLLLELYRQTHPERMTSAAAASSVRDVPVHSEQASQEAMPSSAQHEPVPSVKSTARAYDDYAHDGLLTGTGAISLVAGVGASSFAQLQPGSFADDAHDGLDSAPVVLESPFTERVDGVFSEVFDIVDDVDFPAAEQHAKSLLPSPDELGASSFVQLQPGSLLPSPDAFGASSFVQLQPGSLLPQQLAPKSLLSSLGGHVAVSFSASIAFETAVSSDRPVVKAVTSTPTPATKPTTSTPATKPTASTPATKPSASTTATASTPATKPTTSTPATKPSAPTPAPASTSTTKPTTSTPTPATKPTSSTDSNLSTGLPSAMDIHSILTPAATRPNATQVRTSTTAERVLQLIQFLTLAYRGYATLAAIAPVASHWISIADRAATGVEVTDTALNTGAYWACWMSGNPLLYPVLRAAAQAARARVTEAAMGTAANSIVRRFAGHLQTACFARLGWSNPFTPRAVASTSAASSSSWNLMTLLRAAS